MVSTAGLGLSVWPAPSSAHPLLRAPPPPPTPLLRPPAAQWNSNERAHHERFGLWTRKRNWAAGVLQRWSRRIGVAQPIRERGVFEGVCFRCGQRGHERRHCPNSAAESTVVVERQRAKATLVLTPDESGFVHAHLDVAAPCGVRVHLSVDTASKLVEVDLEPAPWCANSPQPSPNTLTLTPALSCPPPPTPPPTHTRHRYLPRRAWVPWTKKHLCRAYERFGECERGSNCRFAHGISELEPSARKVRPHRPHD